MYRVGQQVPYDIVWSLLAVSVVPGNLKVISLKIFTGVISNWQLSGFYGRLLLAVKMVANNVFCKCYLYKGIPKNHLHVYFGCNNRIFHVS